MCCGMRAQNIAALYFGNDCGFAQWHNWVMVRFSS